MINKLKPEENIKLNRLLAKKPINDDDKMVKKTKEYDIFNFRPDNRDKIDQKHVKRLMDSIRSRNLLELRPISVNEDMEVIDGQHRLLAAKELNVEIYYQMQSDLGCEDIILMNISKAWSLMDYLNYYVKNGYPEYVKMNDFMKENGLALKTALSIQIGGLHEGYNNFKAGKFKFTDEDINDNLNICWETINIIKKNGHRCDYVKSNKFWRGLLKLINHADFDLETFYNKLKKMIDSVGVRVSEKDYCSMFVNIYNYRNQNKISLTMDIV